MPKIEGLDSYTGEWCHTGLWPKTPLELTGKRVGVIGTGATAVQLITEIAKEVDHLTVFQRTANYCAPLHNGPIDPEAQKKIKASYPEIFKKCSESFAKSNHTRLVHSSGQV
jgi:cation diffusion facilitator CzcD-associated flavoprotein CzcO